MKSTGTENKKDGSFYTPKWCVDILLSMSGWISLSFEDKSKVKVIDPSCGDGAILCCMVDCYLKELNELVSNNKITKTTLYQLSKKFLGNLYGIEKVDEEANKAITNIFDVVKQYDCDTVITEKDINIITGDTFVVGSQYFDTFDYVIGNPPYVRIHNLDEKPDSNWIGGMCDLYYAFYDYGLRLLKDNGVLCYISPSSWFSCVAGEKMRAFLQDAKCLEAVLDFEHYQVFSNALTYTAIVKLVKNQQFDEINVWKFSPGENGEDNVCEVVSKIKTENCWCNGLFYPNDITNIKDILTYKIPEKDKQVIVRNGYATMLDKCFISKDGIDVKATTKENICLEIDVIKSSRGVKNKAIYPYYKDGSLISIDDIKSISVDIYNHLVDNKEDLLKRNRIKLDEWWGYGRSQGIVDTYKDKIAIQSLLKPEKELLCVEANGGVGIYGGLYVIGLDIKQLKKAFQDDKFKQYIIALKKYKSGGYYTFSGKELELYLNWWINNC